MEMTPIAPELAPAHFFHEPPGRGGYQLADFSTFWKTRRMMEVELLRRQIVRAAQFTATFRFFLPDHPAVNRAKALLAPTLRFVSRFAEFEENFHPLLVSASFMTGFSFASHR